MKCKFGEAEHALQSLLEACKRYDTPFIEMCYFAALDVWEVDVDEIKGYGSTCADALTDLTTHTNMIYHQEPERKNSAKKEGTNNG